MQEESLVPPREYEVRDPGFFILINNNTKSCILNSEMVTATVRKLIASKQALGVEALLVTMSDLTALWHVRVTFLFQLYFWN